MSTSWKLYCKSVSSVVSMYSATLSSTFITHRSARVGRQSRQIQQLPEAAADEENSARLAERHVLDYRRSRPQRRRSRAAIHIGLRIGYTRCALDMHVLSVKSIHFLAHLLLLKRIRTYEYTCTTYQLMPVTISRE